MTDDPLATDTSARRHLEAALAALGGRRTGVAALIRQALMQLGHEDESLRPDQLNASNDG